MTDDELKALIGSNARTIQANAEQVTALTSKVRYNEQLFETLRTEARNDREETRRLWDDAVSQMERDRVEAKAQTDADRAETANRFDSLQEVIQRLLVELVEMNRDNRRLRDRVDRLEAS